MSLVGCRSWCPTDLQHLCCKAIINKNKLPSNPNRVVRRYEIRLPVYNYDYFEIIR